MKTIIWYPMDALDHPDLVNIIDEWPLDVRDMLGDMLIIEIDSEALRELKQSYPYLLSSSQRIE